MRHPASTGFTRLLPGSRLVKISLPTNLLPVGNYPVTSIKLPLWKTYSDSLCIFLKNNSNYQHTGEPPKKFSALFLAILRIVGSYQVATR